MAKYLATIHVEVQANSPPEAARLAVLKVLNQPQVDVGLDCPDGGYVTLGVNEDPRVEPILLQGDANAVN